MLGSRTNTEIGGVFGISKQSVDQMFVAEGLRSVGTLQRVVRVTNLNVKNGWRKRLG